MNILTVHLCVLCVALAISAIGAAEAGGQVASRAVAVTENAYTIISDKNDPGTYDLGTVPAESSVTHIVKLRNDFDEVLEISSSRASCACTGIFIGQMSLKPHQQTDVIISIATGIHVERKTIAVILDAKVGGRSLEIRYNLQMTVAAVIVFPKKESILGIENVVLGQPASREISIQRGSYPLAWDQVAISAEDEWLMNLGTPYQIRLTSA